MSKSSLWVPYGEIISLLGAVDSETIKAICDLIDKYPWFATTVIVVADTKSSKRRKYGRA